MPNPVVKLVIEKGAALAFGSGSRVSPANVKLIFTAEIPEGYVEVAPSKNPGVLEVRLDLPSRGTSPKVYETQAARKERHAAILKRQKLQRDAKRELAALDAETAQSAVGKPSA